MLWLPRHHTAPATEHLRVPAAWTCGCTRRHTGTPVPGATAASTAENILGYFKAADAQQREDAPPAGQDTGHATIVLWLCCEIALGHHGLAGPVVGRREDEDRCDGSLEPLAQTVQLAV